MRYRFPAFVCAGHTCGSRDALYAHSGSALVTSFHVCLITPEQVSMTETPPSPPASPALLSTPHPVHPTWSQYLALFIPGATPLFDFLLLLFFALLLRLGF